MKVAVVKESAPGERRVALVPEMIARLRAAGLEVLVESGAGDGAWLADSAYAEAGATVVSREELLADADLVLTVGKPDEEILGRLRSGQAILGIPAIRRLFETRFGDDRIVSGDQFESIAAGLALIGREPDVERWRCA